MSKKLAKSLCRLIKRTVATSEASRRRRPQKQSLATESLEVRTLMTSATGISLSDAFPEAPVADEVSGERGVHFDSETGEIRVQGTSSNDTVTVDQEGSNIAVKMRVGSTIVSAATLPEADIERVVFRGYGGNDYFLNRTDVPSAVFGGSGNDRILGGGGDDFLSGGDGDDQVLGGPGRDALLGGDGKDKLWTDSRDVGFDSGSGRDVVTGDLVDSPIANGGIIYSPITGEARIEGTSGNDTVEVRQSRARMWITLKRDGQLIDIANLHFASVRLVSFHGYEGNDSFKNHTTKNTVLHGGEGNDRLSGGRGTNQISGGAGADQLFGNSGNDHLFKDNSDVTVSGGSGSDRVTNESPYELITYDPLTGEVYIRGTAHMDRVSVDSDGNDVVITSKDHRDTIKQTRLSKSSVTRVVFDGSSGDDAFHNRSDVPSVASGAGDDQLFGGTGNDILDGGSGNDIIVGREGRDVLLGRDGNDKVWRDSADIAGSGSGRDVVVYPDRPDAVHPLAYAGIMFDPVSGVVQVEGSDARDSVKLDRSGDRFIVTQKRDGVLVDRANLDAANVKKVVFRGYGHNDAFHNRTNVDSIADGGRGNDQLFGGTGNDVLDGGSGNDIIVGRAGRDELLGRDGNDKVWRDNADIIVGSGSGRDVVVYPDRPDAVHPLAYAGIMFDPISGVVQIEGSDANDSVALDRSGNRFIVTQKRDGVLVDSANLDAAYVKKVVFRGYGHNDAFHNRTNVDSIANGGRGNDQLFGGTGNDILDGGSGNDIIVGRAGRDELLGRDGNDKVWRDSKDITVGIGSGRDVVVYPDRPDAEHPLAYAGIMFDPVSGVVQIEGSDVRDSVGVDRSVNRLIVGIRDRFGRIVDSANLDARYVNEIVFRGYGANDEFRNRTSIPAKAYGGSGSDELYGGSGNDHLMGGADNDVLFGGIGVDRLWGHSGDDELHGGANNDYLMGGSDNDQLFGDGGVDRLWGHSGDDELRGGADNDYLMGGSGNDDLYGEGGLDHLWGQSGNDGLFGGIGNEDYLNGGSGDDRFLTMSRVEKQRYWKNKWDEILGRRSYRTVTIVEDNVADRAEGDAVINFFDGSGAWSDEEIRQVDRGFAAIHDLTGSTRLLKDSHNQAELQLFRDTGTEHAYNRIADHHIHFEDAAFPEGERWVAQVTIHEIGHNWDESHESSSAQFIHAPMFYASFYALSGWSETDGPGKTEGEFDGETSGWFYETSTAEFARGYGSFEPVEDFATSFAAYFMEETRRTTSSSPAEYALSNWRFVEDWDASGDFVDYFDNSATSTAKIDIIEAIVRSIT